MSHDISKTGGDNNMQYSILLVSSNRIMKLVSERFWNSRTCLNLCLERSRSWNSLGMILETSLKSKHHWKSFSKRFRNVVKDVVYPRTSKQIESSGLIWNFKKKGPNTIRTTMRFAKIFKSTGFSNILGNAEGGVGPQLGVVDRPSFRNTSNIGSQRPYILPRAS